MRREVMRALASLADREYQDRVWRARIYPGLDFHDDFKANIDCLFDDRAVLPDPEKRSGSVLLPGDEMHRRPDGEEFPARLERAGCGIAHARAGVHAHLHNA